MKRRHVPYMFSIPVALILLALLYAGRSGASAKGLVADGWNQAFYSSLSANGSVSAYDFAIDKPITGFPHLNLTGFPLIILEAGQPPYLANHYNPLLVHPESNAPLYATKNTATWTATPTIRPRFGTPPFTALTETYRSVSPITPDATNFYLDFASLSTTCKGSTFPNVEGLPPYDQVHINWGDVPGATKYLVAILGQDVPSWSVPTLILASGEFDTPEAALTLNATLVRDVVNARGTFIILIEAQNDDANFDGICVISRIIFAVPRIPTSTPIPPTWTPWPNNPNPGQPTKHCYFNQKQQWICS